MYKKGSPCNHNFLKVITNYHSQATPIRGLHAEKIAKAVWLYVVRVIFPASLLIFLCFVFFKELEETARYMGLLLAPAEGFCFQLLAFFARRAKKDLIMLFWLI